MSDLAAICDRCRTEVPDGAGYLCVRYEDIHRCRRETRAWQEAHPGDAHDIRELLSMPDDIAWRVYHAACDPWPDRDAYQIDVERIRTWQQLARWTSDLMAKNWLADSDWDDLLRELADDRGTRLVAIKARAA
jgi:hypothetical protein